MLTFSPHDPDCDADGLLDGQEIALGTGLFDSDIDDDGLLDGAEVNTHGTDPLDADSDDDGLKDGEEVDIYTTNPLDSDTMRTPSEMGRKSPTTAVH